VGEFLGWVGHTLGDFPHWLMERSCYNGDVPYLAGISAVDFIIIF